MHEGDLGAQGTDLFHRSGPRHFLVLVFQRRVNGPVPIHICFVPFPYATVPIDVIHITGNSLAHAVMS